MKVPPPAPPPLGEVSGAAAVLSGEAVPPFELAAEPVLAFPLAPDPLPFTVPVSVPAFPMPAVEPDVPGADVPDTLFAEAAPPVPGPEPPRSSVLWSVSVVPAPAVLAALDAPPLEPCAPAAPTPPVPLLPFPPLPPLAS
ncbi:MAG TPA: hypothetical protein VKU84_08590 [Stellaceae bacterium]|nr:hypothetical protein [Stellaceae bacterium]